MSKGQIQNLSLHFPWLFFHLRLHKFDKQFLPITLTPLQLFPCNVVSGLTVML
nr:MAG TPA: hypothetical protein [Caudoviricetes sp.]